MRSSATWLAGILLAACSSTALAAGASDPCTHFAWNVTRELRLFASTPARWTAGKTAAAAPHLRPGKLYELSLSPQDQVHFALSPGKKALADGAYAGLADLRVPAAGLYRISLDTPFWIDVVADGKLLAAQNFTGNHQCRRPRSLRKLVEFQLPAGKVLVQLSGGPWKQVRVAVTPSPPKS